MDPTDKQSQRERYERYLKKHYRSRDERKRIQEEAKRRKAELRQSGRPARSHQVPEAEDEDLFFEKIRRTPRAPRGSSAKAAEVFLRQSEGSVPATVRAVHRTRIELLGADGRELEGTPPTDLALVVGDHVRVQLREAAPVRVVELEERRSRLVRSDPSAHGSERLLAANVDVGVVVAAVKEPDLRWGLIHRVVIGLLRGGVRPLVLLSKLDLLEPGEDARDPTELSALTALGVRVLSVSVPKETGLEELRTELEAQTCVFVGHSGVGKSTLINALTPEANQPTRTGRTFDGKGRHTTSSSRLFELGRGTRLIDTPGIRAFGLWKPDAGAVDGLFPELSEAAQDCRFADCAHETEPDCGVRRAVEGGAIPSSRLEAYRRLISSLS